MASCILLFPLVPISLLSGSVMACQNVPPFLTSREVTLLTVSRVHT